MQVAYIWDDFLGVPVLQAVLLSIAPADAVSEVRLIATCVTKSSGGHGAVSEIYGLLT